MQISATSSWGSNAQYTLFYAFDLDGREISRQNDTCEVMDNLALDHNRNGTVCPIYADSIDVVGDVKGPKELRVVDGSANKVDPTEPVQKLRYAYKDGRYQKVGSISLKGTASLTAAAINEQGMKLMKEGKYQARDAYKKYLELAPDSKSASDVKKKLDVLPSSP